MVQITDLKAKRINPSDKPIADGSIPGLRLEPGREKGQGKWTLRFVSPVTGKRRDMGLGAYPTVSIAEARGKGLAARQLIAANKDPIDERETDRAACKVAAEALNFEEAAMKVHAELSQGWKNPKHAAQWINTLKLEAFPVMGKQKVAKLTPADFADVLRPIWLTKPETASRIKQRCHAVMKWCWARGFISANPVDVVDHLLAKQPGKRERTQHQPAMPWLNIPTFVQEHLRSKNPNVTRALLEFVILTAVRSGEARAITWDEVDLKARVWTIPAGRMKAKTVHRVPLAARVIEILEQQRDKYSNIQLIFPSPRGKILSDMVLTKFLRDHKAHSSDQGRIATVHGFRSSFRDWASEKGYARDLAERALAHTIKDQSEAAYHRTDLLEQRRKMMDAWAQYVGSCTRTREVVSIKNEVVAS